ncbi:nucleotide-binding alpha-beta plait domain-containing protein [Tanacetum coccineum]
MGSHRSKEDDVNRISTSIFVTNFPESTSAKELFHLCKRYGHVVDAYIPVKRTKTGKRFGFVRFINVFNEERLVNNLCTIWVDRLKLHANIARFQRPPMNKDKPFEKKNNVPIRGVAQDPRTEARKEVSNNSYVNVVKSKFSTGPGDVDSGHLALLLNCTTESKGPISKKNVGMESWFSVLKQASLDFIPDGRIVWVEVEGVPFKLWSRNTFKRIAAKWGDLLDVDDQGESCFHSKRLCLFQRRFY